MPGRSDHVGDGHGNWIAREIVEIQVRRYLRRRALSTLFLTPNQLKWLEAWSRGEIVLQVERALLERVLLVMRQFDHGARWYETDRPPVVGKPGNGESG